MHALAGSKKVQLLQQLEGACQALGLSLVLHTKGKKEDGSEQMARVLEAARASGATPLVGVLPKVSGGRGLRPVLRCSSKGESRWRALR